jgi:hypothetical protein
VRANAEACISRIHAQVPVVTTGKRVTPPIELRCR